MRKPIVCCPGSINPDLKIKTNVDKGMKTFIGEYSEDLGGKGCDTCAAIKNICGEEREVYLVGCVGIDKWAPFVLQKLRSKNIDTSYVFQKKGKTGIVLEYIYKNGEVNVGLDPGANRELTIEDITLASKIIQRSALVVGQIENSIEALAYSFKLAAEAKVPTLLDPSVVPSNKEERRTLFREVLPRTTILMPDRYEFQELTGIEPREKKDLVEGAKKLLQHCKILCITLGSKGVFVSDRKQYQVVPPFPTISVDGGGVGDVFRGVFGYKVTEYGEAKGCTIEAIPFEILVDAARYASAAAAIAISRPGTFEAIPTKNEIERFLQKRERN